MKLERKIMRLCRVLLILGGGPDWGLIDRPFRLIGLLPALRNNQALGTAFGDRLKVAIKDNGNYSGNA